MVTLVKRCPWWIDEYGWNNIDKKYEDNLVMSEKQGILT